MKIETSLESVARLIAVRAIVVGPRGRERCSLVLDTAAVYTTLSLKLAADLGFTREQGHRDTVIRSAVADEHGYLVTLPQVTTLGLVVRDVEANVADLGYGIDGLLGLNILGGLNFEVRPAERRILVERIAGR